MLHYFLFLAILLLPLHSNAYDPRLRGFSGNLGRALDNADWRDEIQARRGQRRLERFLDFAPDLRHVSVSLGKRGRRLRLADLLRLQLKTRSVPKTRD